MIRIYIMLAVFATVSALGFFGYKFVNDLVTENAVLIANDKLLQQGIANTKAANASLISDISLQGTILTTTNTALQNARDTVTTLETKLSKHDLGYLAKNKPALVERIINKATANIGRCFEIAAGSALTNKEINAVKPSQINSECPALANPNFKEQSK